MSTNDKRGSRRSSGKSAAHADADRRSLTGDDDVLELIHTIMHQYRSQQYRLLRDGPHDITHMEGKVLLYFGNHPGATQSDLSAHSGRDKAQLARLVKGLRDRELLAARSNPDDRRNVHLALTAQGEALQKSLIQQGKRLGAVAVEGFAAEEREQLRDLLKRMSRSLEESC